MGSSGMSNLVSDQISKVKRLMHLHVQYSQFTGNAVTDVSASCSVSLNCYAAQLPAKPEQSCTAVLSLLEVLMEA